MSAMVVEEPVGSLLDMALVGDAGDKIRNRRERLGMSVRALAREAGVDRASLTATESGGPVRPSTIGAIEAALDRLEEEVSGPYDEGPRTVTLRMRGVYGVKDVTVEGPVDDLPALEESLDRLLTRLRSQQSESDSSDS